MMTNVTKHTFANPFIFFMGSILAISLTGCDTPAAPDEQEEHATATAKTKIITTDSGLEIKITDLGTLGGDRSEASSINDKGQIVGNSICHNGETEAFIWEDGKMTHLAELDTPSYAYSINNKGQVVGGHGGSREYFLYDSGEVIDFPELNRPFFITSGLINDSTVIVAERRSDRRAMTWDNGNLIELGSLGGVSSPMAINNKGQVVGYSTYEEGPSLPVLWENGEIIELGIGEGEQASALSINNNGIIVGIKDSYTPVLWKDGNLIELDILTGYIDGWAMSINDEEQVVGYNLTVNESRAFLWQDGKLIDLGACNLGGAKSMATSINEKGQIVGRSETSSGEIHAVLWEIME